MSPNISHPSQLDVGRTPDSLPNLTRRQFIKGLAAVAAVEFLPGCGGSNDHPQQQLRSTVHHASASTIVQPEGPTPIDQEQLAQLQKEAEIQAREADFANHVEAISSDFEVQKPHQSSALLSGNINGSPVHVAVIDLSNPDTFVAVSPGQDRRLVGDYAQEVNAQYAINGNYFFYDPGFFYGPSVSNGEVLGSPDNEANVLFGFDVDNNVVISHMFESHDQPDPSIVHGVSGRLSLVFNGAIDRDGEDHVSEIHERGPLLTDTTINVKNSRSFIGVDETGRYLTMGVIDGGTSSGMTGLEVAQLSLDLGLHNAVLLDGGGSSMLYAEGVGANGIVNNPPPEPDGELRRVGNQLVVGVSRS